jgi:hypothetical protein
MIMGLLKEALDWFVSLTEVGVVIAAMLLIGLAIGMTGFLILSRGLRKLSGPPVELDPYEVELEKMAGAKIVSISPEDDSPPPKLNA